MNFNEFFSFFFQSHLTRRSQQANPQVKLPESKDKPAEAASPATPTEMTPAQVLEARLSALNTAFVQARQQASDLFALHEYLTQVRQTQRVEGGVLEYPLAVTDFEKFENAVLNAIPEKRSIYEASERLVLLADSARNKVSKEAKTKAAANPGYAGNDSNIIKKTEASGYSQRVLPTLQELNQHPLLVMAVEVSSGLVDCLWSRFFASGDLKSFERIINISAGWQKYAEKYPARVDQQPDLPDEVAKEPLPEPLVFATTSFATWSVFANLKDHRTVLMPALEAIVARLKLSHGGSPQDAMLLKHCEWLMVQSAVDHVDE
jgi:hypothetical protein